MHTRVHGTYRYYLVQRISVYSNYLLRSLGSIQLKFSVERTDA